MALRSYSDLGHDDEDRYDLEKGMPESYSAPDYPPGCCFSISAEDLAAAGAEGGEPGDEMRFSAMGEVTSIYKSMDGCRVEIQIGEFAGEDGKFNDLSAPAYVCLCERELGKMGLEPDCERGDMIHLIGTAHLQSSSSTEYGGDMCMLQITSLTYEDESSESRDA